MKWTIIITGSFVGAIALFMVIWLYNMFVISPFDRPWLLSDKEEIIEVTYVNWACDCSDFVETTQYNDNPITEPKSEDYIFIEPSRSDIQPDSAFYNEGHFYKALRLTGRFYLDKGIPKTYEMKTPVKPDHARVFRYNKLEYVDKTRK